MKKSLILLLSACLLVSLGLLFPASTAFAQSDVRAFATQYLTALENADAEKSYAMVQPAERAAKKAVAEKVGKLVKEAQRLDQKGDRPEEAMRIINQAAALNPDDFMVKAVLPKVRLHLALFKALNKVALTNSPLYGGFIRQVKIKLKNSSGLDFEFIELVMEFLDEKGGTLASEKIQLSRSDRWNPKGCCFPGYSGEIEVIASAPKKFRERTRAVKVRLVRLIKFS